MRKEKYSINSKYFDSFFLPPNVRTTFLTNLDLFLGFDIVCTLNNKLEVQSRAA